MNTMRTFKLAFVCDKLFLIYIRECSIFIGIIFAFLLHYSRQPQQISHDTKKICLREIRLKLV